MNQEEISFSGTTVQFGEYSWQVDYPVKNAFWIGERIIVLYAPDAYKEKFGQFPNLVAFNLKGGLIWTAALPTNESGDSYVTIVSRNPLVVDSWKSIRCELALETGKIKKKQFYK